MLLGEPPRSPWDLNFSLFGIPVRVHPWFWLVGLFLGMNAGLRGALIWIAVLFVAILFHELGHALVIRSYGFHPWIVLYGLGGLACHNPSEGYRARQSGTGQQILISLAGPGAGFLLAGIVVAVVYFTGHGIQFGLGGLWGIWIAMDPVRSEVLTLFIRGLLVFCIIWGAVNLLPVYPLDGGQITREILVYLSPRNGIRQSLVLSIVTAVLIGVYGLARLRDPFITIFFGYLAFTSYATLQRYSGRGPW